MHQLIRHAEWLDKGMFPVSGGTRDQSRWFMDWYDCWKREVARYTPRDIGGV